MRIVFIGTVEFSYKALERLLAIDADICGVVTRKSSRFNADYRDITPLCNDFKIPFTYVSDINSDESIAWINSQRPDIIFCFGWSQLLKKKVLNSAPLGVVGYHPAELPFNKGRHPIIWALALGMGHTASTFFFMDEGPDTGDILSQERIEIKAEDNAGTLYRKVVNVALGQIEAFLPKLASKTYERIQQDPKMGNTWRKREPSDGKIDWRMSARCIHNLVRALDRPYVGAHFEYKSTKYKVWGTKIITVKQRNIEPGKILSINENGPIVKCGEGAIQLITVDPPPDFKLGEYL